MLRRIILSFVFGVFLIPVFLTSWAYTDDTAKFVARKSVLTLSLAKSIASACQNKAKELGYSVGIVILDESGNVKLEYLMDNQSTISLEWAKAKALSAFGFKQPTVKGEFRVWNIGSRTMVLGVSGGVPLIDGDKILGALGISGTKGKDDGIIASAGLDALKSVLKK